MIFVPIPLQGRGRYKRGFLPEVQVNQWRKGSQWFEMSREMAVAVVNDTKYYRKFLRFCRRHCYNDEHYFPTILSISYPHLMANRSLTYVDWTKAGFHPKTFHASEISSGVIDTMRGKDTCFYNETTENVCFLFARKLAPSCTGRLWLLLDYLGY